MLTAEAEKAMVILRNAIRHIRRAHMSRAFVLPLPDEQAVRLMEDILINRFAAL